ncbi:MAG: N-acetyltransferase [Gammaproteobacteria bacterium]|nr:N-acetyltransferase [Gammaproteobacteria bacterium]
MTSTPTTTLIRRARREDCPGILAIYNEAVLTTTASYDVEPRTLEHRLAWFDDHQRHDYAVFVAEEGGELTGWSSLSRYHDRHGYRFTCENSVYVAARHRGRGLGARLLAPLIDAARDRGLHSIIAVIDASNDASLRLHLRFGFEKVGHFREVGHKFGRWLDVAYLQRLV